MTPPQPRKAATKTKRLAKKYRPKCKQCSHIGKQEFGRERVKANLEGKSPFSCESCGSRLGYVWLPVKQEA